MVPLLAYFVGKREIAGAVLNSTLIDGTIHLANAEFRDIRGVEASASGVICISQVDPWIAASSATGISWLRILLDLNSSFYLPGDTVKIYYSKHLETEPFAESRTVYVSLEGHGRKEIIIQLPQESHDLRFDLTERKGLTPVSKISIECFKYNTDLYAHCFPNAPDKNGVIILSHDLTKSGAPLLAYDIAKALKQRGLPVVVFSLSSGSHELEQAYLASYIPVHPLFFAESPEFEPSEKHVPQTSNMLQWLHDHGYTAAILNTVVSGNWAGLFKRHGYRVTTLIHESANTIYVYGWKYFLSEAAQFSDSVVFPCESVMSEDAEYVNHFNGEVVIRPQGVRFKNSNQLDCELSNSLMQKLGIMPNDIVVLGVGTICLRKGIDLFVAACSALQNQSCNKTKFKFIWIGDGSEELKRWMEVQINRSSMNETIQIIPFMEPSKYRCVLKRADFFWSTSRADTFPSVVLEAMHEKVPVLAFKNAGGADTMLSSQRGVLIDNFSPESLALETRNMLEQPDDRNAFTNAACKWTRETLKFDDYIDDLLAILNKEECVNSDFAEDILSTWNSVPEHNPTIGSTTPESEIARAQNMRTHQTVSLAHSIGSIFRKSKAPAILDTSISTDDAGDMIIMDYCMQACKAIFRTSDLDSFPTHVYDPSLEAIGSKKLILCGTDLIYTQMEETTQWALPHDLTNFSDICTLGIGMQDSGTDLPFSDYSKKLLGYLLNNGNIHSVRDQYTKDRLAEIGIANVVNTSCPTMWNLTPEHCEAIRKGKGRYCITTLNQFDPDPANDAFMVNALVSSYERVYLWLQGPFDYYQCVRGVIDPTSITILPSRLSALDEVLSLPDMDYVGVRLHAGIRALNHGCRTLVVAIDNRSRHISKDTGLPIIERKDLITDLEERIKRPFETRITLPFEAIAEWKNQFSR